MRLRIEKYQAPHYTVRDEEGGQHQIVFFDKSIAGDRPKGLEGRFVDCTELVVVTEMPLKPRLVETDG